MKSWIKKKSNAKAATGVPTAALGSAPMSQAIAQIQSAPYPQAVSGMPGQPTGQPMPYGQQAAAQIMPQLVAGQAHPGQVLQQPVQMQAPQAMGLPVMPSPQMPSPQLPNPQTHPAPMQQQPYGQAAPMAAPQPLGQPAMPAPQMMPQPMQAAPQALADAQPHLVAPATLDAMPMSVTQSPISAPEPEARSREEGELALPAISIQAFCERPETAGAVQATTRDWRMSRTNVKVYMGGLPAAVEFYHTENTPSLILIESGMRGPELFAQLERLASVCDADTKVVVIGATNDIRLYRELMEKGVSDYIVPPFHPLTLIRSLSEVYVDPEKPFTGRVAAFFGAKGGVGSSTIAHNIAWALSTAHQQETALVDLDASWGTTGLDFNYDNIQGLEEALASPDRLDETLLDRIMIRHTPKLSLLPAGASLGSSKMETPEAYQAIVQGIRKISPLTILDMPHSWTQWTSDTLIGADDVVITATPDLANLRNTKNLLEYLRAERPNDLDPILILNKTGVPKTPEIPVKDFAAALGLEPSLVLPYEPVLYAQASNDGKMLAEMKTDGAAVNGFGHIGHRLKSGTFEGNKKMGTKSKGSLLGKLTKKKK